ncbi:oligoendopeptidase F, partial [Escherichia coli]|nr:oligoendopeptidase F [Escherichia coli]
DDVNLEFTYEEAKELVLEALKPLGDEYQAILKEAFDSRWIDVMENKGKRSGAYSSGSYSTSPYILLNWQDNINNVYTLAHELGHSVHSYYTRKNQPFV